MTLGVILKAQALKEKIDKLSFIKVQNFCASKETLNRMKRKHTEWEKILRNHV